MNGPVENFVVAPERPPSTEGGEVPAHAWIGAIFWLGAWWVVSVFLDALSPELRSARSELIVSRAQDLLEPMNPLGPRLIHPTTYIPGTSSSPCPRTTRPRRCGIVAVAWSNGTPGTSTPR